MAVSEVRVPVNKLEVGQSIRLPLSWKEHPFLFSRFTIKDSQQIAIIAKLGLKYVYLQADPASAELMQQSLQAEPQVAPSPEPAQPSEEELALLRAQEQERQETIDYHRQVRRCEQAYNKALEQLKAAYGYLAASPDRAFAEASSVIATVQEQLEAHGEQVLLLQVSANQDGKGLHYHGLNVCVLAMILGRTCDFEPADIRLVAMAALFHDVGKLRIPHSILNKRIPLTKPEQAYVDAHPKMALEMLKGAALGHKRIKQMVANHHEMLDGSGYPQGLKGEAICTLTQLLSVANEYDHLINGSHKRLSPHLALAYLFKFRRGQLNPEFMQNLVKVLGLYPTGSLVRLSNDAVAKVVGVDEQDQKSPRVIIYDPKVPRREARVVSLVGLGLKVQEPLVEAELPSSIRDYLSLNLGGA
ncbi:HD domain-containing phosphohydrolase [Ferrimonas sp. YFM]|uniref:HD-GYP domain-containing protein n=1 Tax=Ferrimonas sp. YFM TaxID=3028878 RepID=UPI00257413B0|nr:HD domain-containing phosphohydrolase [Ferrimonas sp. YFM]BDY04724.1 HD family phosphohydrolase [Ferrimonas sp. YFM]